MRALLSGVQQQQNQGRGCHPSNVPNVVQRVAVFLVATVLLNSVLTCADFTDLVKTASNYALADVANENAKIIQNLLQYKWNATSAAVLRDALKSATAKQGIYGAAAAFSASAIRKYDITNAPLYSPYCHEPPAATADTAVDQVTCMDIGNLTAGGGYNYTDASLPQTNWYTQFYKMPEPMAKMSGVYFDKGAGEIWMDTYSVPVMSPDGKNMLAVATADIRIDSEGSSSSNNTAQSSAAAVAEPWGSRGLLLPVAAVLGALLLLN